MSPLPHRAACLLTFATATLWLVSIAWQLRHPQPAEVATPKATGSTVNVNIADVQTLSVLPGLGEGKATAIIEYRRTHGPITAVEQLANVHGIGPITVEKLRPWVRFEHP